MRLLSISLVLVGALVACGPSGRGDDTGGGGDGGDGSGGNFAELKGKVWAPNQAPGQAMAGQEIPIAGALVYVSATKPDPIPDRVYCEQCVPTPSGGALTGADGSFSLQVPPGRYWVVIQKGQFRLEAEYELQLGTLELPAPQTTLPSTWDPATGRYMPRMAMATGTNDQIEDILGKLGVGTMSGNTFQNPMGEKGPELDIYDYEGTAAGSVTFLLSNIAEMRKYHIIFFPCSVSMSDVDTLLQNQTILGNIRRYVSEGGKLYVTDWSGELADRAFPQQVVLGDSGTDSDGTYDATTFTGTLTTVGDADGGLYEAPDGKTLDAELGAWLGLQMGPTEGGTGVSMYNPQSFVVTDLWNWVKKMNTVQIGVDGTGMPVYDAPKAWVSGSKSGTTGAMNRPIAVTYQPAGCGKVLFTTFQTANGEHDGLYPQERVLLYLIMEITTCSDNPIL
ncbi:MAG: hypothetical protein H0T46_11875 [Deltaproteobacteria bacterium]|nr:hypothetical protein [Deltaproteobacteria bacterium]